MAAFHHIAHCSVLLRRARFPHEAMIHVRERHREEMLGTPVACHYVFNRELDTSGIKMNALLLKPQKRARSIGFPDRFV
jgi:hypothetical protein